MAEIVALRSEQERKPQIGDWRIIAIRHPEGYRSEDEPVGHDLPLEECEWDDPLVEQFWVEQFDYPPSLDDEDGDPDWQYIEWFGTLDKAQSFVERMKMKERGE